MTAERGEPAGTVCRQARKQLWSCSCPLEDHAHVVKPRDECRAVDLSAAACTVAETDDVGARLPQPGLEGKPFRVVHQWDESSFPVVVVTHQDGKAAALGEHARG